MTDTRLPVTVLSGVMLRARPPCTARGNRGATSLGRRRRAADPMAEYARLPARLRHWLAAARLPWRPGSVLLACRRALADTRDPDRALAALNRLEARLIARDAACIWGAEHPAAQSAPHQPPISHVIAARAAVCTA